MAYNVGDRIQRCGSRMREINSEAAVYAIAATGEEISLRATPGRNSIDSPAPAGEGTTLDRRDWIVTATELITAVGASVTPQEEDTLTDSSGRVWRLVHDEVEGGVWRPTSVTRDRYRLHTVRVN